MADDDVGVDDLGGRSDGSRAKGSARAARAVERRKATGRDGGGARLQGAAEGRAAGGGSDVQFDFRLERAKTPRGPLGARSPGTTGRGKFGSGGAKALAMGGAG